MYDESSQPGNSCKLINKEIELNRIVSLCYHYAIRVPKNKTKSLGNPLPPKRSVALCKLVYENITKDTRTRFITITQFI